jgi:membrane-associated phospholipid phosphatase
VLTGPTRRRLALAAAALLLIIGSVLFLDRPIAELCRRVPDAARVTALWFSHLAGIAVAGAVMLIMVGIYFIRVRDRRLLYPPAAALAAWAVTMLLKVVFARYRPALLFDDGLYGFGFFKAGYWFNSFPSGHAATAFGFLVALALARPRWRVPCVTGAVLLGLSRVLINAHFLSDVLAGALLGATAAVLFARLFIPREA